MVVGKPCDVAATQRAAARPRLAEKVAVTIGIFCAGTPTTKATIATIRHLGVDPAGSPGSTTGATAGPGSPGGDSAGHRASMTYAESWGACQSTASGAATSAPTTPASSPTCRSATPGTGPSSRGGRSVAGRRAHRARPSAARVGVASGALDGTVLSRPAARVAAEPGVHAWSGLGAAAGHDVMGMPAPRFRRLPSFRLWWRLPPAARRARPSARSSGSSYVGCGGQSSKPTRCSDMSRRTDILMITYRSAGYVHLSLPRLLDTWARTTASGCGTTATTRPRSRQSVATVPTTACTVPPQPGERPATRAHELAVGDSRARVRLQGRRRLPRVARTGSTPSPPPTTPTPTSG